MLVVKMFHVISAGDAKPQIMKRRRKVCYDFLASIDQTGECKVVTVLWHWKLTASVEKNPRS